MKAMREWKEEKDMEVSSFPRKLPFRDRTSSHPSLWYLKIMNPEWSLALTTRLFPLSSSMNWIAPPWYAYRTHTFPLL